MKSIIRVLTGVSLKILREVSGIVCIGTSLSLIVLGLINKFSVSDLILIAICSFIINLGVKMTLNRIEADKDKDGKSTRDNND